MAKATIAHTKGGAASESVYFSHLFFFFIQLGVAGGTRDTGFGIGTT